MSAAHGCRVGDSVYTGAGASIGVCRKSQQSGKVDTAFVETNLNYEPSNSLYYTNNSGSTTGSRVTLAETSYATNIVERTMIFKVGKSSFLTSGNVTSVSVYSANMEGVKLTDLIQSNMVVKLGDSGGCASCCTDYH